MSKIVSTADTCGGEPRIDGTRIMVRNVLGSLACPAGHAVVQAEYPGLTPKQINSALNYAIGALNAPKPAREVVGWRVKDVTDGLYASWLTDDGPARWEENNQHVWSDDPDRYRPKPMTRKAARALIQRLRKHYAFGGTYRFVRVTRPVRP